VQLVNFLLYSILWFGNYTQHTIKDDLNNAGNKICDWSSTMEYKCVHLKYIKLNRRCAGGIPVNVTIITDISNFNKISKKGNLPYNEHVTLG
jgi:hypothetical protein